MTFGDSVNMHGKTDAVADKEDYYDERDVDVYPRDEEPEEVLKVVKSKGLEKKNKTNDDDQEDEEGEGAKDSGWTPINKNKASESSSSRSSKDEVQQLKEKDAQLETKTDQLTEKLTALIAKVSQRAHLQITKGMVTVTKPCVLDERRFPRHSFTLWLVTLLCSGRLFFSKRTTAHGESSLSLSTLSLASNLYSKPSVILGSIQYLSVIV